MGVLVGHAREQVPFSICGKDAYQPWAGGLLAIVCSECGITSCTACASQPADAQGISVHQCPRCHKGGLATYLDTALIPNSVWTMPPQKHDGWPDLDPMLYARMIGEVEHYLPVLKAVFAGVVPEQDIPAVVERLCFALVTGKYMEWCYNRQEDVRTYTGAKSVPDFEAPSLPKMVVSVR